MSEPTTDNREDPAIEIKTVGVVGCGLMGSGIAQVCAQAGYQVVVREINGQFLKAGLGKIEKTLGGAVTKGKMAEAEMQAILGRVKGTTTLQDFGGCDLVIEAAIENLDEKKKIFAELDAVCPPTPSSPATRPRSRSSPWRLRQSARSRSWGCTSSTRCRS